MPVGAEQFFEAAEQAEQLLASPAYEVSHCHSRTRNDDMGSIQIDENLIFGI